MKNMHLDKLAKQYILDAIDSNGYEDCPYYNDCQTDEDKMQFLRSVFHSEYNHEIQRSGECNALREWIMGLPTVFNIEYRNHEILELAVSWGSIPADYTDAKANKILDNWFNLVANKTVQLFRKYKVTAQCSTY